MTSHVLKVLSPVVLAAVAAWALAEQPESRPGADAVPAGASSPDDLALRLAALDPADPMGYFTLGEDVADLASGQPTPARRSAALMIARRLFVLSAHLSGGASTRELRHLRHSAYLALAALAENADEAAWLRAVASTVEPERNTVRWEPAPRVLAADQGAYDLAVAIGRYRSGEFRRVRDALRKQPEAAALLSNVGVEPRRAAALISLLETDSARAPQACTRCKGARVIRSFAEGGSSAELCPQCLGNPAPVPPLSAGAFAEQLRVEAALLGASPWSWSAQAGVVGLSALRDIDPAAVASYYGIDPEATVFRAGAWTAAQGAPVPGHAPPDAR